MKKSELNNIYKKDIKRNNTITKYICAIVIIFSIFLSALTLYIDQNKTEYIKYNEQGKIDYKVYLKENNFFEKEYIEENNQYISTLIDYIESNFKYNLSLEQETTYKYTYKIVETVKIIDKTTKRPLYNKEEIIIPEKEKITNEKNININEQIKINYNKYNDLMNNFINIYEVGNTESNLTVSMIIDIIGSSEDFKNNKKNESVITLTIPLTTNTMAIDIKNNLIDTNNIIICEEKSKLNIIYLLIMPISLIIDAILTLKLIRYIKKTRSNKTKYEKEIKKILNNYRQYIQKVDNQTLFENYEQISLSTFTDLLEIRDTVQGPILMIEQKTYTKFMIPTDNILYIYTVKVNKWKNYQNT